MATNKDTKQIWIGIKLWPFIVELQQRGQKIKRECYSGRNIERKATFNVDFHGLGTFVKTMKTLHPFPRRIFMYIEYFICSFRGSWTPQIHPKNPWFKKWGNNKEWKWDFEGGNKGKKSILKYIQTETVSMVNI